MSALALLVPATLIMLSGRRAGRHSAVSPGNERWVLIAVAAVGVAVGAFAGTLAIGALPRTGAVSALLLGVAVLAWAPLTRTWPVAGVTVWALVVAATGGVVASATAAALVASAAWTGAAVSAVGAALLVPALGFVHRRLRTLLGVRAGARKQVQLPVYLRPWLLRPAIALGVFVAAFSVSGLTGEGIGADGSGGHRADDGPGTSVADDASLGTSSRLVSSTSRTPSAGLADAGPTGSPGEPAATDDSTSTHGASEAAAPPPRSLRTPASAGAAVGDGSTPSSAPSSTSTPTSSTSPAPSPDAEEPTTPSPVTSVTETVTKVVDPVVGTVDKVTEPVEEVTDPVTGVVEDVTESVTSTVEQVTEPVEETVSEVTDTVTSLLP